LKKKTGGFQKSTLPDLHNTKRKIQNAKLRKDVWIHFILPA
jgi:hypothetical protein